MTWGLSWAAGWRMGPRRAALESGRPLEELLQNPVRNDAACTQAASALTITGDRVKEVKSVACVLGPRKEEGSLMEGSQVSSSCQLLGEGMDYPFQFSSLLTQMGDDPHPPTPRQDHEKGVGSPPYPLSLDSPEGREKERDEIMEQRGLEPHFFPSLQWKTLWERGALGGAWRELDEVMVLKFVLLGAANLATRLSFLSSK